MCDHGCKVGVDCAHDREQDTWLTGITDLVRTHDSDVKLGAGRMCGNGHPLRGSASADGEWWCHPSCNCHPDCYVHATTSRKAPVSDAQPEPVHAPALTVDGFTEALRRDGGSDPYTRGARRGW